VSAPTPSHSSTTPRITIGLFVFALLVGCSQGGGATPTPSPTPTPTQVPSPSGPAKLQPSQAAQAYLVPLAGYEYVALPPSIDSQMAATFGANEAIQQYGKGYAATSVVKGSEPKAVVVVLELDRTVTSLPGFEDGFWRGVGGSSGATPKATTIAGQEVRTVDTASTKLVGWLDGQLIVLVVSPDNMANATEVAQALIKAHA
jgi:hypothetical protein